VILSASVVDDDQLAASTAGSDDFLRKPFQEADVFTLLARHLGARFVYDEMPGISTNTFEMSAISPANAAAIANLPADLRAQLAQATQAIDLAQMLQLIAGLRAAHPSAAAHLERLTQDFEYQRILTLLGIERAPLPTPSPR